MASFSVPQPVASKTVRWNLSRQKGYYEQAGAKFKPSTELFCCKCMARGMVKEAYGFCKVCVDFLCNKCFESHDSTLLTLNHGVIVGNEMLTRYRRAMKERKNSGRTMSRNHLDMVADGRASLEYGGNDHVSGKKSITCSATLEAKLAFERRIRTDADKHKCFICACTVYNNGNIVVADANNKSLKLFNNQFTCLFVFSLKQEPWDICKAVDFDSDLFVTEAKINGIHQFKVGQEIRYVFTLKTDGQCFGLTHWKGGVAVSVKKNQQFSVKLLDQFGNIYLDIPDGYEGRLKLVSPWYLSASREVQTILISDSGAGTVSCIDVDKGIKFISRNRKELCDPRSITVDENRNIFVVDYEADTVHQMTSAGKDLGVILCTLDGLANSCGMTCHNKQLYIQTKMDTNDIKIFDLS